MFTDSLSHPKMQTLLLEPDLSLNISPPSISEAKEKETMGRSYFNTKALYYHNDLCSSTSDSTSSASGSELSHENGFLHHSDPTLRLGFGQTDFNHNLHHYHHQVQGISRNFNHHMKPQIYGRDFKRNTRVVNGARRSVRAPRMRWTTTLHAHFVHAVQLLGGHESELIFHQTFNNILLAIISEYYIYILAMFLRKMSENHSCDLCIHFSVISRITFWL